MPDDIKSPSYENVIAYYLRDDVSEFFWKLSQTRQLKFFHHCETDPQGNDRARPQSIVVHCSPSVEELRKRIRAVTIDIPDYPYDFYPFWGMQSSQINAPGKVEQTIGWDIRFELDFDLQNSFDILLPIAGILTAFNVPIILKYSGHRSLHLIIPAESFPLSMKKNAKREHWARALENLGHLFYRIAPNITTTLVGLSKELILTAPYSFHRYYGLLSCPLDFDQAFNYNPEEAQLDRFSQPHWLFKDTWFEGTGMEKLLDVAERVYDEPHILFEIAEKAFKEGIWDEYIRRQLPPDIPMNSPLALLMVGVVGINHLEGYSLTTQKRLKEALLAMDNPIGKTHKFSGLVDSPLGYNLPISHYVRVRRVKAEILNVWATKGFDKAFEQLIDLVSTDNYAFPVLLAVRILSLLPETDATLIEWLSKAWEERNHIKDEIKLFLTIALAERCGGKHKVIEILAQHPTDSQTPRFKQTLFESTKWQAESRPDLVLIALTLVFGEKIVQSWVENPDDKTADLAIRTVFSAKKGKFIHAARSIGLLNKVK